MTKLITHNFIIKLICLLLATGLWVYVASKDARIDTFPGSIPLKVLNTPQNLVAVKDISNVTLRVVAENSVWKKLTSDNFEAYIDLAGLSEGVQELPISAKCSINGVQIVEVKPSKVLVRIEALSSKTVPVEVKVEGSAAEGYTTAEMEINPKEVAIFGAKSVIDQISQATAIIKLNNESDQIEKTVQLATYDAENNKVEGVQFTPGEVKITLPIIKGGTTKTVGINAQFSGMVKAGYWVSQVSITPPTVAIIGTSTRLSQTNYLQTQVINIEGLGSDKTQKVSLDLPNGLTLVNDNKVQVEVSIKVSPISSQKEVTASLNYQNLANNLAVSAIDPVSVKVLISGFSDKLQLLDSSQVVLNLDLAKYTSVGTYAIDIAKSNITLPEGLQVTSVVPSSIRVTVGNK